MERLSNGTRINRAADGPAALVISEQMRSQIAGVRQAIDNSEVTISMIQTAEANLQSVSALLTNMRQLAIHASNEGANNEQMLQADQQEISNSIETITRIAETAGYGTLNLLDGSRGGMGSVTGEGLILKSVGNKTADSRDEGMDVLVTQNAARSSRTGSQALTDEVIQAGEEITLIEDGMVIRYNTKATDTPDLIAKNIQSLANENSLDLDVEVTEDKRLKVTHRKWGEKHSFQVYSSTAGVLSEAADVETVKNGKNIEGRIHGHTAVGEGRVLKGIFGAPTEGLEVEFHKILDEIPESGVNVGRVYVTQNSAKFQIGGNYGQSALSSIGSMKAEDLGKYVENQSGFSSLADVDLTNFQGAQDSLRIIETAIDDVTKKRGELGAFQKNTLESNLQNLRVGNENLTSSESIIRDTDMAKEMAEFTRNQIMAQSGVAMLAQANQSPQIVMKLLA